MGKVMVLVLSFLPSNFTKINHIHSKAHVHTDLLHT